MTDQSHTGRLETALAGRYRIERKLGEGGMASVYLAEDLKHKRNVALKILRPELAAVLGAERFLAEIQTTAALQHPHILPLFDSGNADGYLYYVMPYIEGETLRERIDREKQLGVEESVRIARDVADALDYAHRHGVIHRDIKPGNILLHDGRPVVADFGIALAVSAAGGGRMTETGLSLGTPHYMSPEQASADRDLTARSDVYSLGCVLYEMLAGQPPHTGPSAQSILVHILTESPRALTQLRHTVPPNVAAAVTKAIEKLPADRFESAKEFMEALEDQGFAYQARPVTAATRADPIAASPSGAAARSWLRDGRSVAAVVVGIGFAALAAWSWLQPAPPPGVPTASQVTGLTMDMVNNNRQLAISPGGRWIAAVGRTERGTLALFVRSASDVAWRELPNTENGDSPTFSPDGDWIAFERPGAGIFKVPRIGGRAELVVGNGTQPHWGANDTIVVAFGSNLYTVPGEGDGEAEVLFDGLGRGIDADFPYMLPDGSGVLFSTYTAGDPLNGRIMLYDRKTDQITPLVPSGNNPRYVPTGHILYGNGDQVLMAVPFDLKTKAVGTPRPVVDELTVMPGGDAQYDVSTSGTLIYNGAPAPNGGAGPERSFVEVALDGTATPLLSVPPGSLFTPRYSPDGDRLAYEDGGEIYVYDFGTRGTQLLTEAGGRTPVWSPDGRYIYFTSNREGSDGIDGYRRRADRSERAEHVFSRPGSNYVRAILAGASGDSLVIVRDITSTGDRDLLVMELGPNGSVPENPTFRDYLTTGANEIEAEISNDGRWVAYASDQGGAFAVYLESFPTTTGTRRVSPGPGMDPQWAPDNDSILYYRDGTSFYEIDPFTVAVQRLLFDYPQFTDGGVTHPTHWDVHPDGTRFILMEVRSAEAPAAEASGDSEREVTPAERLEDVYLVANWFTQLKELMGER